MKEHPPTTAEWQQLYALMQQVKQVAPWEFMTEEMVFGVQNPQTSDIGFISVMGSLGEHLSIAVYLGITALYHFWAVHEQQAPAEQILEISHLQASFEDRELVTPEDRAVIKAVGLKFRGRQAWPLFRSYRPGFVPWHLTQDEARFLIHALTQMLVIAQRLAENDETLEPPDEFTYLVRVPSMQGDDIVWQDQMMHILPPEPQGINIQMDLNALTFVKSLPQRNVNVEIDFFMMPVRIQEKKEDRPFFAYNLLLVDSQSGIILGVQTMGADPSFEDMLGRVPLEIVHILAQSSLRPKSILVRPSRTQMLLAPLCEGLGIHLKIKPKLRELDAAKASFMAFLER